MAYANVVRNSGAGAMLLPYRKHRAGTIAVGPTGAVLSPSEDTLYLTWG